jgi:hypothetical protein
MLFRQLVPVIKLRNIIPTPIHMIISKAWAILRGRLARVLVKWTVRFATDEAAQIVARGSIMFQYCAHFANLSASIPQIWLTDGFVKLGTYNTPNQNAQKNNASTPFIPTPWKLQSSAFQTTAPLTSIPKMSGNCKNDETNRSHLDGGHLQLVRMGVFALSVLILGLNRLLALSLMFSSFVVIGLGVWLGWD